MQPLVKGFGYHLFKNSVNLVRGNSWVEVVGYNPIAVDSETWKCSNEEDDSVLEPLSFSVIQLHNCQSVPTRNDDYIKMLH